MFNSVETYPRACPDSSHFQSRLAHLSVGMTLLSPSLFEQVDSTFSELCVEHSAAFLIYKGALAECTSADFKKCCVQVQSVHMNAPNPAFEVWINPLLLTRAWQVDTEVRTDGHQYSSINFPCRLFLSHICVWVAQSSRSNQHIVNRDLESNDPCQWFHFEANTI